MNLSFTDHTDIDHIFTQQQSAWAISGMKDVKRILGVAKVFPYVNGNGGHWTDRQVSDPGQNFAMSDYYAAARKIVAAAGAVGIDIPPSMVIGRALGGRSTTGIAPPYPAEYLHHVVGEIQWAKHRNYKVIIYVSPFQVGSGGTAQFGYDPDFYENTLALVSILRRHINPRDGKDDLPDYWQVGQYSNSPVTNTIGNESDHESIASVTQALIGSVSGGR